jgi:O-antigen/teichoic acid export membrane protein
MQNSPSRTINSLRNTFYAISGQGINSILQFVLRTIFIKTLGVEYLGVNGLFTNILSVLSLAELGLGTTIIYSLYRPLANKDENKTAILIKIYKKVYAAIGAIILIIGMAIVPFLDNLIKDSPNVGNLRLIYVLFLVDSVASYFFAHYRSLLNADQKGYISTVNIMFFAIIQTILQVVILIIYRNFYVYLVIKIISNVISGYALAWKARKIYPFLCKKIVGKLTSIEMKSLVKNSIAMFLHKMGYIMLNNTDNIIISAFIGSVAVGLYSNYALLIGTISTILGLFTTALQASIGNLVVSSNENHNYNVFLKLNFLFAWIYGFCAICLLILVSPFITLWIGNDFVIEGTIVCVLALNVYIQGNRQAVVTFTTANGLFYDMRFKPIIEVLLNLILSLILVREFGMLGVFVGTVISTILTSFWYEPYILFSRGFKKPVRIYFFRYFINIIVFILATLITKYACNQFVEVSMMNFAIKMILCITIPNVIYIVVFFKTKEFIYLKETFKYMINRQIRKKKIINVFHMFFGVM